MARFTRSWTQAVLLFGLVVGLAVGCAQGQAGGGAGGTGGGATGGQLGAGGTAQSGGASGASGIPGGTGGTAGAMGSPIGTGGSASGATGGTGTGGRAGMAGAAGSGGIKGAAGAPGSGGMAGVAGAGGTAGRAPAGGSSGAGGWSLGGASRCAGSPFPICQDFESTANGATPAGDWSLPSTNYGVGTVTVASDYAARGSHALKVSIPAGGSSAEHYLQVKNLGPLANGHFGRIFFRIQSPTTTPFVHWDLVLGAGPYMGQSRRIRWGVTGSGIANWTWIYNIEQGDTGTGSSVHPIGNTWMCLEWQWDAANQKVRFYFNDAEVQAFHLDTKLPNGQGLQVPTFTSLSFGLAKYQSTNTDLVFWIDEIAVDAQRIGCAN